MNGKLYLVCLLAVVATGTGNLLAQEEIPGSRDAIIKNDPPPTTAAQAKRFLIKLCKIPSSAEITEFTCYPSYENPGMPGMASITWGWHRSGWVDRQGNVTRFVLKINRNL